MNTLSKTLRTVRPLKMLGVLKQVNNLFQTIQSLTTSLIPFSVSILFLPITHPFIPSVYFPSLFLRLPPSLFLYLSICVGVYAFFGRGSDRYTSLIDICGHVGRACGDAGKLCEHDDRNVSEEHGSVSGELEVTVLVGLVNQAPRSASQASAKAEAAHSAVAYSQSISREYSFTT